MNVKNLPVSAEPRNVAVEALRRPVKVDREAERIQSLFDLYIECMAGSRS